MIRLLAVFALTVLGGCASVPPGAFSFALIGDLQYTPHEEQLFPHLIDAMNAESLKFVVHVGDFKAGSNSRCTDALFAFRKADFDRSAHPFIYLPGDNDWVDCRRKSNHGDNPLERLDALRKIFHATPESLGKSRIHLDRQSTWGGEFSPYVENTMWQTGGVIFAALNVQASNDNVGFDTEGDAEQKVRTRANIAWMKEAFRIARDSSAVGVVLFLQANPGFEESPEVARASAQAEFISAFEEEARRNVLPILFAHGDTHTFRIDQPYVSPLDKRPISHVTRVECYGSPFINWVRITVDSANRNHPFRIESGGFWAPSDPR